MLPAQSSQASLHPVQEQVDSSMQLLLVEGHEVGIREAPKYLEAVSLAARQRLPQLGNLRMSGHPLRGHLFAADGGSQTGQGGETSGGGLVVEAGLHHDAERLLDRFQDSDVRRRELHVHAEPAGEDHGLVHRSGQSAAGVPPVRIRRDRHGREADHERVQRNQLTKTVQVLDVVVHGRPIDAQPVGNRFHGDLLDVQPAGSLDDPSARQTGSTSACAATGTERRVQF